MRLDIQSCMAVCLTLIHSTNAIPSPRIDERSFSLSNIIHRDVLVVGGGSTGTYGAIKLLDAKKTVVVVEKESQMGGHTNTYTDPNSGVAVDYGVVVFHNNDFVKKYFSRFNIPLSVATFGPSITKNVDFRTGKEVTNYIAKNPGPALQGYAAQLFKYPYVEKGFELQYPVPEDLLLPFGKFLEKYSLQDMSQFIFGYAQGLGDLFNQPTLYVFKNFGSEIIQDLQIGFLETKRRDNSELYRSAAAELHAKKSLLLSSKIICMERSSTGVKAIVSTPSGLKLILAKQVLLTTPPKPKLLGFFDLNDRERHLFSQFKNAGYWTGLLRNTGIPDNYTLKSVSSDTPDFVPALPGLYSLYWSGVPGLGQFKYGSPFDLSDDAVRSSVEEAIRNVGTAGTLSGVGEGPIKFEAFDAHTPFELTVSSEAIKNGFYKKLYALQNTRSTWYTGATFHTHDSSLLWEFTDGVVAKMLTVLGG